MRRRETIHAAPAFCWLAIVCSPMGANDPEPHVLGRLDGITARTLRASEEPLAQALLRTSTSPSGGAFSTFETAQVHFAVQEKGQPASADGNAVLLAWELSGAPGQVQVLLNATVLCTAPAGTTSCLVSGLAPSCDPSQDPQCVGNLPADCQLFGQPTNGNIFEVRGSGGATSSLCQQVVSTVPVFTFMQCCSRLALSSQGCEPMFNNFGCNRLASAPDECGIIVGGGNVGPPGSSLELIVDGATAFRIDGDNNSERFCFERFVPVETQGAHALSIRRFVDRDKADSIFWTSPDGSVQLAGLVGSFLSDFECPASPPTTCGSPSPGGRRYPGDANTDGTVDVSDPVNLLARLFAVSDKPLPCEAGDFGGPGNRKVFDWNGDGEVDISDPVAELSHLFLGGDGHVAGPIDVCVSMTGCQSDRCSP